MLLNKRNTRVFNNAASRRKLRKSTQSRSQATFESNTYRGLTFEDYLQMSLEEILQRMTSSARRYFRRGLSGEAVNFFNRTLTEPIESVIRTHSREFFILPIFVGRTIEVHNGREFIPLRVKMEMVGYRLGEFALTRRRPTHKSPGIGASRSSKARAMAKT